MKKLVSTFLTIAIIITMVQWPTIKVNAATYSGSCGKNLTYSFDAQTGVLKIEGTGGMDNNYYDDAPWYSYRNDILSIEFPEGLTSIGDCAFYDCYSLASITLPESLTSIGYFAFYGCEQLKTIYNYSHLPIRAGKCSYEEGSEDYAGYYADTVYWYYTDAGYCGENLTYNFDAQTGILKIEGTGDMNDYDYYDIEAPWYSYRKDILSIELSEGVTSIGEYAFSGCSSLASITLPEGVTSIADRAFEGCSSLASITLPEGLTSIGSYAFLGCSSLENIMLPEGLIQIDNAGFKNCTKLTTITIPRNVEYIGDSAFSGCTSLKTVYNYSCLPIKAHTTTYGNVAYYADVVYWEFTDIGSCGENLNYSFDIDTKILKIQGTGPMWNYDSWDGAPWSHYAGLITTVEFSDSVTSIGEYAFDGCSALTTIELPKELTHIWYSAFRDCTGLTSITIPYKVKRISYDAFYGCTNLKTIHNYSALDIKKGSEEHGYVAYYADEVHAYTHTHKGGTPTCYEGAVCDICGNNYGDLAPHKIKTTKQPATFAASGYIRKECEVCESWSVYSYTSIPMVSTVKLSATSYTYNGKAKTPTVTLKDSAGNTLKKGTDYTVAYASGRKNVGKYKVTIKLKGNYSGTKTLYFKINPPKTEISKVTAAKKALKVTVAKKSTQVTGYEIQYSTSKKFTSAKTKTISSYKTTKTTLSKLSAKKTYYVRVRTYKTVNGSKYYSGWSTSKAKKTK